MAEMSASENARTPERRSAIGSRLRANRTMRHLTQRLRAGIDGTRNQSLFDAADE